MTRRRLNHPKPPARRRCRYPVSRAVRYRVGQRLPMARRTPVADCRFFLRQMPGPVSSQPPPATGDRVVSHSAAGLSKTGPLPACPLLCQGLNQPAPLGRLVRWPIRDTVNIPSTRVPGVSITTSAPRRLPPPTVRRLICRGWLAVCHAPIATCRLRLSRIPHYADRCLSQAVRDSITRRSADCLLTHAVQSTGYLR